MSALCQKQTLPDSLAGRLRQPQATDCERLQDANASIPKADVVGCQFSANKRQRASQKQCSKRAGPLRREWSASRGEPLSRRRITVHTRRLWDPVQEVAIPPQHGPIKAGRGAAVAELGGRIRQPPRERVGPSVGRQSSDKGVLD